MNDDAHSGGDDSFTAEEQAAFDAYAAGGEVPAAPVGGSESAPGGVAAPEVPAGAAAAHAPAGEAAAPGDVVDPEAEDGSPEENKGKFVRHGAFHQEREKRKAAERELADLREKFARGDERLRLLTQAMQAGQRAPQQPAQAPTEPAKAPDPNEDIFGAYAHLLKEVEALRSGQQQMTETQKQEAEATRATEERNSVIAAFNRDHHRYLQAEPTYGEAYRYLVDGRVAELKMFGLSDQEAIAHANADEESFIRACFARNVSPAEQAFALAKTRGFAPKAPEPAPPAAPPAETAAERQTRLANGQAASKSLSSAGGAPAGEVTLDMLAGMSESEFEAFQAKNPDKVARFMGQAA